jgi:branched-chain amino acid aminotransferase
MSDWVSIDGEIMPASAGRVPIYDRGFLYGDSVFETLRTYSGKVHAMARHLARLRSSALRIAMELQISEAELEEQIAALLKMRPDEDSYLRLIVSRGDGEFGLAPDLATTQRVVLMARPLPPRDEGFWRQGVAAISLTEPGHRRGEAVAKTGNYLTNLLALDQARRAGAHEALRFDASDQLTEGSTSNVFLLRNGRLYTPDLSAGVLPGITRQLLIEVANTIGHEISECPVPRNWVVEAEELMISSTLRECVAVVSLDKKTIGEGRPGAVCLALHAAYKEHCLGQS